jgi:hypothetical protein
MLSIAFASLFAVVAMASPASIAGRADCTAIRSGILSANLSGQYALALEGITYADS